MIETLIPHIVTGLIAGVCAFLGVKIDVENLKTRVGYLERKAGLK